MTVFNSAYDTTAGSGFQTSRVIHAIKEAVIRDQIDSMNTGIVTNFQEDEYHGVLIANQYPSLALIPFFTHPIIVDIKDQKRGPNQVRTKVIFTDIRAFASVREFDQKFILKNKMEYDLAKLRTVLNLIWVKDSPLKLRDLSPVPVSVYASWISEGISRRYALDPKDQMLLSIISGIFYFTLFERQELTEENKMRINSAVARATRVSAKEVLDIMDQITELNNIKDFVKNVKSILQNTRLDDFNEGMLISILGNSWFGTNAKEMLAVALEHPPTWISIVYSSFVERSYKNSAIAKISDRYALAKGQNDFTRSIVSIIQDYLDEDDSARN